MRSKLKLILRVGVPFLAWVNKEKYGEFEDDTVVIEKGLSVLIDFATHVEDKFLLKERFFGCGEVVYFLNKSLIEHHMEEMEYKKR
jgi:hypothetical protein